jgi:hypothetical protein
MGLGKEGKATSIKNAQSWHEYSVNSLKTRVIFIIA